MGGFRFSDSQSDCTKQCHYRSDRYAASLTSGLSPGDRDFCIDISTRLYTVLTTQHRSTRYSLQYGNIIRICQRDHRPTGFLPTLRHDTTSTETYRRRMSCFTPDIHNPISSVSEPVVRRSMCSAMAPSRSCASIARESTNSFSCTGGDNVSQLRASKSGLILLSKSSKRRFCEGGEVCLSRSNCPEITAYTGRISSGIWLRSPGGYFGGGGPARPGAAEPFPAGAPRGGPCGGP